MSTTEDTVILYLDLYFLMNALVNLMLLGGVKRLTGEKGGILRLSAAAVVGAGWACAVLFLPRLPAVWEILLTWIAVGGSMTAVAFGIGKLRRFGRNLGSLWIVSALAGGILNGIGEHIRGISYLTGGMTAEHVGWYAVCFWTAGLYFLICAFWRQLREWNRGQKMLYEVTLFYHGKKKTVTALWDTGNHLFEPYGHQPVHVVTAGVCAGLGGRFSRVIYIPFQAVGTGCGMLPGIQVDSMEVVREGKVIRSYIKPWLAISREPLSPENQYEMLLHGDGY